MPISSEVERGSKQYLTFRVARHDLAIDAGRVRAIVPLEEMMEIPNARAGVAGVVSVAGRVVAVLDLCVRLGLAAGTQGARRKVVVAEATGGHLAGFVADRVSDVIHYRARDLRNGVLHGAGRPRRLVDVDEVVDEADLVHLWQARGPAAAGEP